MKKAIVAATAAVSLSAALAQAAAFQTGSLVVESIGTSAGAASNPVTLSEFAPTGGASIQTIALPNAAVRPAANPFNLTDSGNATSNGYFARSADGLTLAIPGYNGITGDASIAGSNAATISRTIGVATQSGTVDTSRSLNMLSANNYRSVVSSNGSLFWAAGAGGITYVDNTNTVTSLITANTRIVNIFGNQLYASSSSASFNGAGSPLGIWTVGSGLPTGAAPTLTNLIATGTGSSPYDFAISPDGKTVYIADDRASAAGGIQKWTSTSGAAGSFTLAYTLGTGATNIGARSLTVDFSTLNPTIYATTAEGTADRLISIADAGATSTATTLETAATNTIFRGVDFAPVPEPASLGLLALSSLMFLRRSRKA